MRYKRMFYIYRITNLINGKTYIGQHKYKKLNDNYMGSGVHLRRAQKKYGMESLKKDILVFGIVKKSFIDLLEKEYIKFYRSIGKAEYNIADGGEGGDILKYASKERKDAHRKKLAEALKGKKFSEEHKMKLSEAKKGKPSPSKGKKLGPLSEETRRKMSEAKKGEKNSFYGKHHTEETKRKIADAQRGKPISEETRRKMSEAKKGEKNSFYGKHLSDETKQKIAESRKGKTAWNKGNASSYKGKHWKLIDGKRFYY